MIGIKPPSKGKANSLRAELITVEFQASLKYSSLVCWLAFVDKARESGRE